MKNLLEFSGLTVSLPSSLAKAGSEKECQNGFKVVLHDINFSLSYGQMVAIIGPNGAGKSTLIKAILNLIPYKVAGSSIEGQPLEDLRDKARAKILSYVPQSIELMGEITVYQWCEMARFSHQSFGFGLGNSDKAAIDYAINACDLQSLKMVSMNNLSGGERQRALIAGALAQEAKVIVLDEPTSHLDPGHAIEILSLLRRLNKECGQTIICVSHDINQVYQYFDFVYALKNGEYLFDGATELVINRTALSQLYYQNFIEIPYSNTLFFFFFLVSNEK